MAGIRPRKVPASMSRPEKHQLVDPNASGRYQRAPKPPIRRPTRSLHISISLFILAAFVLYAQRKGLPKFRQAYEAGGKALPEYYGICSKEGDQVYTVPEDEGVGAVQCVVVGGKYVVDTGSLGGCNADTLFSQGVELLLRPCASEMG